MTNEQINANKLRYIELLMKLNVDLTNVTKYLDCERVNYFYKPFNSYQDQAYPGSLCEHSLKLYDELVKLAEQYCPGRYTDEQLIQVALLKDIYRAELYEQYSKNVKNDMTGQWESQLAYRVKEDRPIFAEVQFSSFMIARKFFPLADDEVVEAICFSGNTSNIEIHNIRKTYKLVVLTTMAEAAIGYLGD